MTEEKKWQSKTSRDYNVPEFIQSLIGWFLAATPPSGLLEIFKKMHPKVSKDYWDNLCVATILPMICEDFEDQKRKVSADDDVRRDVYDIAIKNIRQYERSLLNLKGNAVSSKDEAMRLYKNVVAGGQYFRILMDQLKQGADAPVPRLPYITYIRDYASPVSHVCNKAMKQLQAERGTEIGD